MGFEWKHKKRDLEIPKHRAKLMENIELDLMNDDQVLAVYYGGSIGNRNTDLYSDIDLRIVVNDDHFEEYRINKKQRAKKWGNVLFFEDFPWSTYSIAHYDTFIKVDTFYYRMTDIQPSIWLQNIKIVLDRTGIMKKTLQQSNALSYVPTIEEVETWRTKFFAYVHETYRRIMREEIYYSLQCIDYLRFSMVTAWYMEMGIQPNTFGDWAKIEGNQSRLTDCQLSLLKQWFSKRNPNEMLQVIKNMIPEFKRVHKSLCKQIGLDQDPKWVDQVLRKVL